MTADQFAYWLQGFAELNSEPPSAEQWQAIRDHLGLVFEKRTPNYIGPQPNRYILPNDYSRSPTCAANPPLRAVSIC